MRWRGDTRPLTRRCVRGGAGLSNRVLGVSVGSPLVGAEKSRLAESTVEAVVHDTLHELPDDGSTHWTARLMASVTGSVTTPWRGSGMTTN